MFKKRQKAITVATESVTVIVKNRKGFSQKENDDIKMIVAEGVEARKSIADICVDIIESLECDNIVASVGKDVKTNSTEINM